MNYSYTAVLPTLSVKAGAGPKPKILIATRVLKQKYYELKDHLGNVRATISDLRTMQNSLASATVESYNTYYPFGMLMPGRQYASDGYRYGFNGKEMDNDMRGGTGATYDYGFRIYDSRIAKFLSVDPLTKEYPWYTPYQFAGNTPIQAFDIDGLEPGYFMGGRHPFTHRFGTWHAYDMNTVQYKNYELYLKIHNIAWNGKSHEPNINAIKDQVTSKYGNYWGYEGNSYYHVLVDMANKAIAGRPDYFDPERKLNSLQLSELKIKRETAAYNALIAKINKFNAAQKITFSEVVSLTADGAAVGLCVYGIFTGVETIPSVVAGIISADNFQKDVRVLYEKLNKEHDPNNFFGTLGGELEKSITGLDHDYIYSIAGIVANWSGKTGTYSAIVKVYNKQSKVEDSFTIVVNSTQDIQSLKGMNE